MGDWARRAELPVAGGFHRCELCTQNADTSNLGIPGGGFLYVCPGMIAHYIRDHHYRPPAEFINAVQACPEPGTFEYYTATAPFSCQLRSKSLSIHRLVATLRMAMGPRQIIAADGRAIGADSIWIKDFNLEGPQRRALVTVKAGEDGLHVELGSGAFHAPDDFAVERAIDGMATAALIDLVRREFVPRPARYGLPPHGAV